MPEVSTALSNLPKLRVRRGKLPDGKALTHPAFSDEAGSYSSSATRVGMDDVQSLIFLEERVGECRQAFERSGGLLGRIYNGLTGSEAQYVVLPGNIAMRILGVVQTCPDWMQISGEYEFRLDVAESYLTSFRNVLKDAGLVKA